MVSGAPVAAAAAASGVAAVVEAPWLMIASKHYLLQPSVPSQNVEHKRTLLPLVATAGIGRLAVVAAAVVAAAVGLHSVVEVFAAEESPYCQGQAVTMSSQVDSGTDTHFPSLLAVAAAAGGKHTPCQIVGVAVAVAFAASTPAIAEQTIQPRTNFPHYCREVSETVVVLVVVGLDVVAAELSVAGSRLVAEEEPAVVAAHMHFVAVVAAGCRHCLTLAEAVGKPLAFAATWQPAERMTFQLSVVAVEG